jgi:hypothetical protein
MNDKPRWKKVWYPKREEEGERFGYITLRQNLCFTTLVLNACFQMLSQDHDLMLEERQTSEEHLVKMESRLQEVLHKFELEGRRKHNDFATEYAELTPEDGPKVFLVYHFQILIFIFYRW